MKSLLTIAVLLLLTGCYSERKARGQHAKAVVAYPKIGAEFCAENYKPKDSIAPGITVTVIDTIYQGGEIITDTVFSKDTVHIRTIVQQPGRVITNTVHRVDTMYIENIAALKVAANERRQAIELLAAKTTESDKWRTIALKRFWIIAGMGAVIGIGLFLRIRKMFTPKK